jgi:HD-GYP domain-containing protein (c-di-GMP phosphodiesterase class II)
VGEEGEEDSVQATGRLSASAEARAATVVGQLERLRPETFAHARRVAAYAVRVARHAHFPEQLVSQIYWGALVHDVGELNVAPALLQRHSTLDEREQMEITRHTIVGARWLTGVPGLASLVPFARWHHERFDGLGYPDGATAQKVPLTVALVGVCDTLDELVAPRSPREPMTVDEALAELQDESGRRFSRALVTWTVECLENDGIDEVDLEGIDDLEGDLGDLDD